MTANDIREYLVPAMAALDLDINVGGATLLESLLNKEEYKRWPKFDKPIADDYRELLIALNSPHAKTILRAYQIRHGLEIR